MNEPPPSGCSRPGQNQPSALKSVAAPSATAACDRLAGVGVLRRHRPPRVTRYAARVALLLVALEPARGQQHTAARTDLDRPLGRHRGHARDPSVLGDQPGDRQVGPQLAALADHDRGQPGDQRLTAAERVAPALAGAVPLDRRPHPVRDLGRQVAALDVGRLDRPPERHPTGRVVVLRERQPLEVEVRVRLQLGHQPRRGRQERLDLGPVGVLQDRRQVVARALGRVRRSRPAAAPGCPAASTRRRCTPTCRPACRSSRPRTPTARPSPPAPPPSARRRRTRPPRRHSCPRADGRTCSSRGLTAGRGRPASGRGRASRGRGRRGGRP